MATVKKESPKKQDPIKVEPTTAYFSEIYTPQTMKSFATSKDEESNKISRKSFESTSREKRKSERSSIKSESFKRNSVSRGSTKSIRTGSMSPQTYELKESRPSLCLAQEIITEILDKNIEAPDESRENLVQSNAIRDSLVSKLYEVSGRKAQSNSSKKSARKVSSKMGLARIQEFDNEMKMIEIIGLLDRKSSFDCNGLIFVQTGDGQTVPFRVLESQ